MPDTLTRHELLTLITFAACLREDCVKFARHNPTATDNLIIKELVTVGEPSSGITRSGIPMVTERGHALLGFMCKLPLPVAKTTWELPDPRAEGEDDA